MIDYIYVNILNEGPIPWIREVGPLFGYKMSMGIYHIISKDRRLNIEIVRSQEDVDRAKTEYYASKEKKEPIILHDDIEIKDELSTITEIVATPLVDDLVCMDNEIELESQDDHDYWDDNELEYSGDEQGTEDDLDEDDLDAQVDLLLEILDETPKTPETEYVRIEPVKSDIIRYTEEQLMEMTKAQMKGILRDRGYINGPYAGKYHDTLEILRHKVLTTQ